MRINDKFKGAFCGILAAVTFGTNPFFGVSLYQHGFNTASVLFYRFFVAFLLMLVCMVLRKESFKLSRKQLFLTMLCGVFLALTCLFFYLSFHHLDTGIAATILFVYPLMVCGIMFFVYHIKQSVMTIFGMIFGVAGIVVLSLGNISGKFSMLGLFYVLLSALVYALYMVMLKVTSLKDMSSMPLTFYAMGFSVPVFFLISGFGTELKMISDLPGLLYVLGMALCPSVLSFVFTAIAIRAVGPTKTAILGAVEPVTAILIGVAVFHETLSVPQLIGILIILVAVTLVVSSRNPSSDEKI